jgi:hypothetical protein
MSKEIVWEYEGLLDSLLDSGLEEEDLDYMKALYVITDLLQILREPYFQGEIEKKWVALAHELNLLKKVEDFYRTTPLGAAWVYSVVYDETIASWLVYVMWAKGQLEIFGFKDGEMCIQLSEDGIKMAEEMFG